MTLKRTDLMSDFKEAMKDKQEVRKDTISFATSCDQAV